MYYVIRKKELGLQQRDLADLKAPTPSANNRLQTSENCFAWLHYAPTSLCSDKQLFGKDAASHHVHLWSAQQQGTLSLQFIDAACGHKNLHSLLHSTALSLHKASLKLYLLCSADALISALHHLHDRRFLEATDSSEITSQNATEGVWFCSQSNETEK